MLGTAYISEQACDILYYTLNPESYFDFLLKSKLMTGLLFYLLEFSSASDILYKLGSSLLDSTSSFK